MERRFGADFSQVRVYADAAAERSADSLDARAYTVGERIAFRASEYAPDTARGRHLLAHELAHVVQQRRGPDPDPYGSRDVESGAHEAAQAVLMNSGPVAVRGRSAIGIATAEKGRAGPEDVAAYQRLRRLQEDTDSRSEELRDVLVDRIAKARQSRKNLSAADTAAFAGFMRGKITVAVAYAVDENGDLVKLVSTNRGKHAMMVPLAPDELWVGAAPRSGGPKGKAASSSAGPRIAPPLDHAMPAGSAAGVPSRTSEQAFRDAEANIVAESTKKGWHLVTAGASSSICPHCAARLSAAGSTTASVRRADPEGASVPANISSAMDALRRTDGPPRATVPATGAPVVEPAVLKPAAVEAAAPEPATGSAAESMVTTETGGNLSGASRTETSAEPSASTARITTGKVSWQGASSTATDVRRTGSDDSKTSSTIELRREDGVLGVGRSSSTTSGELDEDDELVRGTERRQNLSGGLIAGPQGVGGQVKGGTDLKTAYGGGRTVTKSFGVDGRVVVDANPVEGSKPLRYQVTMMISLGAKAGIAGGMGTRATGNLGLEASGSLSWTYVHEFSAEETTRYLGVYAANGAGGAEKEWRVLTLVAAGALDEARQLLDLDRSSGFSAVGADQLVEGDVVSVTASGSVAGSAGLSSAGKRSPIGVEVSLSRSGTLRRTVARKGGKVVVTIEVLGETKGTGGLSGSFSAVSGGVGYSRTDSTGRIVSFVLDPADGEGYPQQFERIIQADSVAQLDDLSHGSGVVVAADSRITGWSSELAPKIGFAGLELSPTELHSHSETESTSAAGRTLEVSGSSGVGLNLGVGKGPAVRASTSQQVTSVVGPDNAATGDVTTTSSHTSLSSSLHALATAIEDKPLATTLGLLTGGTPVMQQRTEVAGMKLSDADYTTIATVAANRPSDWDHAFVGHGPVRSLEDWQALRRRIAAADGDRETIARALAQYGSENIGAAEATQAVVRSAGRVEGGARYDWPPRFENERKVFDSIVTGDRLDLVAVEAGAGRFEQAMMHLEADIAKLDALAATIRNRQAEISDAAIVAEMLRRVGDRQAQARAAIIGLRRALTPVDEPAPVGRVGAGRDVVRDPAGDAELAAERSRRIQDLSRAALTLRERETAMVSALRQELDHPPWHRNPDMIRVTHRTADLQKLHVQWELIIEQLRAAYSVAGQDATRADQLGPDKKALHDLRRHPEITKYGMVTQ